MKNFRTASYLALMLVVILAFAPSCGIIEDVQRFSLTVQVAPPQGFPASVATGVRLSLRNTDRGTTDTASTDAMGKAVFASILPGKYEVTGGRSLTAEAAQMLVGRSQAVTLSAFSSSATYNAAQTVNLTLQVAGVGGLVIKEIYYTGSKTPSGGNYFSDQFVELYNNSADTIFTDGLCIADVYGAAGLINPDTRATEFRNDPNNVYVSSVWRIPGTGRQHPLAPGRSIVIAQDGANHGGDTTLNRNSPVDLSRADWETFNQRDDNRDIDFPNVPNLERLYFTGGFDWLLPVFGPTVVLFRTNDFAALERTPIPGAAPTIQPRIKIPRELVIDAVEALRDASSADFKRIAPILDAGFISASGTYTGESVRRRVQSTVSGRAVLQDGNNSSMDFQLLARPTPRRTDGN
ncbi:MAG: DUF4876 domain-containing protein [Candidatus Kapaibacterium sp.]|nr:MAG: DUF4876 domain-containing protein [Candidatus Kapabacteria bacterium]